MRIVSFDIGLRHLAWICFDFDMIAKSVSHIVHWRCDSAVDDLINVNATSLDVLVPLFVKAAQDILSVLDLSTVDLLLIESQPMGHGRSFGGTSMGGSPRNLKTKVFSHILQGMFLERKPTMDIHFVSPTLKMKGCKTPFKERSYKDNKK
jgi:hypothetical protein